jgi:multimeric flavodoxin WrbA
MSEASMKVLGFNGSPRKSWNTAILLQQALDGAASQGATTELLHLYDLKFQGCRSCFFCKRPENQDGICAAQDDLTPVLEEVRRADALVLGSPIYYGTVTGVMKSFLERLAFPYWTYTDPPRSLFPRKISTGFLYTMNVTEEQMQQFGYGAHLKSNERILRHVFGAAESLVSCDTYQFDDYSKMFAPRFDPAKKAQRRAEVFPQEREAAFALGARLVGAVQ